MNDFQTDFANTLDDATRRLLSISEEQAERPRESGKWSPKEIVGHLIDSAANNHVRFVNAQFSDDLVFPGYDQERWVTVQRYQEKSWPELVTLWSAYNRHLLHLIALIPEDSLKKLRTKHSLDQIAWKTVPQKEPITLEYFIRDYLDHMKNHLRQILSD